MNNEIKNSHLRVKQLKHLLRIATWNRDEAAQNMDSIGADLEDEMAKLNSLILMRESKSELVEVIGE